MKLTPLAHRSLRSLLLVTMVFSPTLASATPLTFPARGDSFDDEHFINTRGHAGDTFAIDYGRVRWDEGDKDWTHWTDGATEPYSLEENTTFGTPLYAPEDGYVVACFRNTPDTVDPEANTCSGGCPNDVHAAGNFLVIRSMDDDHAVLLAHFEDDTIPPEVCPNPMTTTDNANASCDIEDWGSYPDNTRLDLVNPGSSYPEVLQGQYLGNIGHSGNSSAPHGHIEIHDLVFDGSGNPCRDTGDPLEWYETWYQDRADGVGPSDEWTKMNGKVATNGSPIIMIPDPLGVAREEHSYNHAASDLNMTSHVSGGVVAYKDGGHRLDLRSYDLDVDGFATVQDKVNEGVVLDVALARPNSTRSVVTSIRGSNGKLKLIPYQVSAGGTIARQYGKEVSEGSIGMVESVPSPAHDGVVVAVKDGGGSLKVIDYHVSPGLTITRDYSSSGTGGAIQELAMTPVSRNFDGVVTAELDQNFGALRLRSFAVPAAGGVSNSDVFFTLAAGTEVAIDTVPVSFNFDEYVVTSLRQLDGTLRVDVWDVDAQGTITWVSTAGAGAISALDGASMGLGDYVSAVRDNSGLMRMIGWSIGDDGQVRRNGTQVFGAVTEVAALRSLSSLGHVVALTTDGSGELVLNTVESNFSWGI